MTPQVYVAGMPIATLAPVSALVISHEWPASGIGGPVSADFSMLLPAGKRPGWIEQRALAEVRFGGMAMLAGALTEPDWTGGSLSIDGAAREGSTTSVLTTAGVATSTPDPAIDAAIARVAVTWSRPASISTTALTDGDSLATFADLTDMLGTYADVSGARLYVDPSRRLLKGADPTVPGVFVIPGAGELAWTTEKQATRVIGRWADSAGTLHTTMVGGGSIEKQVDLTSKGPLTLATATAILNSILARATAGGWTGGLTLAAEQFIGAPHLATIADQVGRGLMVRLLGQRDPRPGRLPVGYVDFIVERSEWHVDDQQIILTPRGMVARDFTAILADVGLSDAA